MPSRVVVQFQKHTGSLLASLQTHAHDGADHAGGEVDERHVGRGTVGCDVRGGDLDARPGSAGVAAVHQIALTKWDWATLLKRVWGFDALACSGCGGQTRFIVVITDRAASERILRRMGEDAEEEIARVATAWDAEALATARAARVATAWVAWRGGRADRTGSGRENSSERDAVEDREERGRACGGQRRRGGTRGSHPRGTRAGGRRSARRAGRAGG